MPFYSFSYSSWLLVNGFQLFGVRTDVRMKTLNWNATLRGISPCYQGACLVRVETWLLISIYQWRLILKLWHGYKGSWLDPSCLTISFALSPAFAVRIRNSYRIMHISIYCILFIGRFIRNLTTECRKLSW